MKILWIRILKIWLKVITIKMKNKSLKMKINVKKTIRWLKKISPQKMRGKKTPIKMKKKARILA